MWIININCVQQIYLIVNNVLSIFLQELMNITNVIIIELDIIIKYTKIK